MGIVVGKAPQHGAFGQHLVPKIHTGAVTKANALPGPARQASVKNLDAEHVFLVFQLLVGEGQADAPRGNSGFWLGWHMMAKPPSSTQASMASW